MRTADPLDLYLFASAGNPLCRGEATEDELALAGACVAVEAELRAGEWAALELLLGYLADDADVPEGEVEALLAAFATLGWCHKGAAAVAP